MDTLECLVKDAGYICSRNGNQLTIRSERSLFRLKTYLDGAVDMYNLTYTTYRIIWLKVSRNKLLLEEIAV